MISRSFLRILPLLIAPGPGLGQEPPSIRLFTLEVTEQLGREIYRHDMASARGADILTASVEDIAANGVIGWITSEDADGFRVSFVGLSRGALVAVYDAWPDRPAASAFKFSRDRALSEREATLFIALRTAMRRIDYTCSRAYNHVILPDPESDGWLVYLLAATSDPGIIPVGGHFRISVSADGTEALRADKLFDSCRALRVDATPVAGEVNPGVMAVTHTLSALPLEIHVYLSLLFHIDLEVETVDDRTWMIHEGSIRAADEDIRQL